MKQIIQDLKKGSTILEEVPSPQIKAGCVLIKTTRSLVSLGTERMLVEFGKANLVQKAKQQPEKVKQVLDKIKAEGLVPTLEAVFNKLNQPLPLGYCNVGIVEEIGENVSEFTIGDRVVSNGPHAEFVCVPKNLVAKIPDNVSDEEATFTVIGAIGLEGIRLCNPTFGETIVVIGLGLIGLITAELLKANGCNVIGFDFDPIKVDIANKKGIIAFNPLNGNNPVNFVNDITKKVGADGVIITASSKSDEIIRQAAEMCRQRGRIVLIGVIGLDIRRNDFYKKEITFQVSCSYGPGRYDESYENKGYDYPIGYVRWTEKRNFEAILKSISAKQIEVDSLITEQEKLSDFYKIYSNMQKKGSIASIIEYNVDVKNIKTVKVIKKNFSYKENKGVIGIIGAGNFTSAMVIPTLKQTGAQIKYIASAGGLTAKNLARKGNISYATSDYKEILNDCDIDTVIITTRHDLHAKMTIEALRAGKNVFVEKPLCLNKEELNAIVTAYNQQQSTNNCQLVVGYNRRFAPITEKIKKLVGNGPKNIVATMNAGFIPPEVWVHDLKVGGGRIIGEACHFIDLCSYIADSKIQSVCMNSMGVAPSEITDNVSILLKYVNGTNAVINYFANGNKAYSKERLEIYSQEKTLIMDNWLTLRGYGTPGFAKLKTKLDKGHKKQFKYFVDSIKKGEALIPIEDIINTTIASFAAIESLKQNQWVNIE